MWLLLLCFGLIFSYGLVAFQAFYLGLLDRIFIWTSRYLTEEILANERKELQKLGKDWKRNPKAKGQQKSKQNKRKRNKKQLLRPVRGVLCEQMQMCCDMIAEGMGLVMEDEVAPRFVSAPLPPGKWNLLTRDLNVPLGMLSLRLKLVWLLALLFRYVLLMPLRTVTCLSCLLVVPTTTAVIGVLCKLPCNRRASRWLLRQCLNMTANFVPILRRYHNPENRPTKGICVCNHTNPLDVLILSCDVHYSLTGQRHDGILGVFQRSLSRVSPHMWFDRREPEEREALGEALRKHVQCPDKPPILLFPEGTCINNSAVMQFRKGSFSVSDIVYPIAIRYGRRYGEAYWDSTRYSMFRYMLMLVTAWCLSCDIWYLPPVARLPNESPVNFAHRVKGMIADQAGLDNLPWDGNLKRVITDRDW
ncbi:glycerol-3-phosphate acyltransferase 4 [Drosophila obscura]|uniref:glycerol-3-phosphate acyltransferase 4 n=1 Tax=Drosophila obscura TaxID=7282 RepID=UPI000BA068E6|nr:glycerol-3-phosphate acyltransferase 4 [Drosophila obscura]XP_041451526.1 glycerol-3-phosphate acyltransferase 4 [Drosophila obscura]XP_041451527.1 glycerol-3-phosphate acyltransferase 4 [Drosophila obscura]